MDTGPYKQDKHTKKGNSSVLQVLKTSHIGEVIGEKTHLEHKKMPKNIWLMDEIKKYPTSQVTTHIYQTLVCLQVLIKCYYYLYFTI